MASSSDANKPHAFNPPTIPTPEPSYRQVCVTPLLPTSRLITLAGQTGALPPPAAQHTQPEGFIDQVDQAYKNLFNALASAGATPRDIIHVRHYIVTKTGQTELDSKPVVERGWGDLWCQFMDRHAAGYRPPDTVLGVASLALDGIWYEVEAWAMVHGVE